MDLKMMFYIAYRNISVTFLLKYISLKVEIEYILYKQ